MATDQRSAFGSEIARLARKHKGLEQVKAVTKNGYTVLLTGMWGGHVGAIVITDPAGHQIRRADGWNIGKTAEIAEFLWDALEKDKARAIERERLAGLKSVSITSTDATGRAAGRETSRYHLTPKQLTQVRSLAEQLASVNAAVTAAE
ncbi:hypothetical protein ABZW47_31795 [Streptomyces sp. NPDC004549]|uniref:hypothetical protein n=1 Tax=Streptomyces sp. NPDC004549 TaxID=3154283 RepID=UPI00339EA7D7